MLDKEYIEDTIVKFKGYYGVITVDKDIEYFKNGDIISSEAIFNFNTYLELYIFILEYSLTWFDSNDQFDEDNAPFTLTKLSDMIDKGNELVKTIIQLPLNY